MSRTQTLMIQIATGDAQPISKRILDGVRKKIATAELRPGDQLPSVRGLAQHWMINSNTVAKACNELAADGWLESRQGLGLYVATPRQRLSDAGRERRIEPAASVLATQKQLARLRHLDVIGGMTVGPAGWSLWVPFAMAYFCWLASVDIHDHMKPMIYGGLIGAVIGLLTTAWFHRWAMRPRRAALGKAWDDSVTGSSLRQAGAVVGELARFERE